jgi:hypothetical protein
MALPIAVVTLAAVACLGLRAHGQTEASTDSIEAEPKVAVS